MRTYRDHGVVLGSHKFGEADKVVIILTRDHGKVRAVAKGVRKTKSSIGARLEPMSIVDVSLRSGRQLDTIDQVRLLSPLNGLRADFDRLRQGLSMVETLDKVTPDREPVPHLFELLSRALRFLDEHSSPLLLSSFFWRVIQLEGQTPQLDVCMNCGGVDDLDHFDLTEGGTHCRRCRIGVPVSNAAVAVLRSILDGRMNEALAMEDSPVVQEVSTLSMSAMEAHLERRLKSLGVFDRHL